MSGVRVALMVEGETERAFLPVLRSFLEERLAGRMPRIKACVYDGRIPTGHKLRHEIGLLLNQNEVVVGLTDVYTGTSDFADAADAKRKMRDWAGEFSNRFYPHAAQYEFEAWLLPYWDRIQAVSGFRGAAPSRPPEDVNHNKPPSSHIKDAFSRGKRRSYVKPRDALKILEGSNLQVAVERCTELKALVNSLLTISGGQPLP